MTLVFNSAVDGPNGIYSLTNDPFLGIEAGRNGASAQGQEVELDDSDGEETEFVIVDAGAGYTESLTNQAVTPVENEAGYTSKGTGLTVDITVANNVVTGVKVGNATGSGYFSGDLLDCAFPNGENNRACRIRVPSIL